MKTIFEILTTSILNVEGRLSLIFIYTLFCTSVLLFGLLGASLLEWLEDKNNSGTLLTVFICSLCGLAILNIYIPIIIFGILLWSLTSPPLKVYVQNFFKH